MAEGVVVKSVSNLHFVRVGDRVVECPARGRLRLGGRRVLTGDRVVVTVSGDRAVIESILPRDTELERPPVANVDVVLLVCTVREPPFNPAFVDRVLLLAEHEGIEAVLCMNKVDVTPEPEVSAAAAPYRAAGYEVRTLSARTGEGVDVLEPRLAGRTAVLAGQSGVGKSTLANALKPGMTFRTADLSPRLGRGRHTTRHVELIQLDVGGMIVDTPGFSRLDLPEVEPGEFPWLFPDFRTVSGRCRFPGCLHSREPGCAVRAAVERRELDAGRYGRYLGLLAEVQEKWAGRY